MKLIKIKIKLTFPGQAEVSLIDLRLAVYSSNFHWFIVPRHHCHCS